MLFINTRPLARANLLSEHVKNQGVDVYELPLLEIIALEISPIERQYLQLMAQGGYDALVIISPSAAQLGLQNYCRVLNDQQQFKIIFDPQCPIITVGAATERALKHCINSRFENVQTPHIVCPKVANNEGMMKMPELATLTRHQRVLIWRGQGGQRLLVDNLQSQGVIVDSIEYYKRQCPADAAKALDNLVKLYQNTELINTTRALACNASTIRATHLIHKYNNVYVLISSGESFAHWCTLLQEYNASHPHTSHPQLHDFGYLVLGERLEAILTQFNSATQPLSYHRITSLEPDCVMAGLTCLSTTNP